jgi:hypothetical protein
MARSKANGRQRQKTTAVNNQMLAIAALLDSQRSILDFFIESRPTRNRPLEVFQRTWHHKKYLAQCPSTAGSFIVFLAQYEGY